LAFAWAALNPVLAADLNGDWKAEFDTPIGPQQYMYSFKLDGNKVTGKAISLMGGEEREVELNDAGPLVAVPPQLQRPFLRVGHPDPKRPMEF
jgi:hypothetical protein